VTVDTFATICRGIAEAPDCQTLLDGTLRQLVADSRFVNGEVLLLDPMGGTWAVGAQTFPTSSADCLELAAVPQEPIPAGCDWLEEIPIAAPEPGHGYERRWSRAAGRLTIPIRSGLQLHGVIRVALSQPNPLSALDREVLLTIGSLMGRVLHRQADTPEIPFEGLLEAAPDAIVIVNRQGSIVLINAQAERVFGYSRTELVDQPIEMLVPQHLRVAHVPMRDGYLASPATRPMGCGTDLLAQRKNGEEFPVEISLAPLSAPGGLLVISTVRDVTQRKQVEAEHLRLLASEQEKAEQLKLSVREAHHRIKNNLQAISDLLYLELSSHDGSSPQEALRESMERVQAIALVHDLLSQDEDVQTADVRAVLERLAPMALQNSGPCSENVHLTMEVPSLRLSSKKITTLALIVNELVSNASKHAFHGGRRGSLSVSLRQESEELVLRVRDDGPGLPSGFQVETGAHVGLSVVRILAQRDLDGSFVLKNQAGVLAEVRFTW
jgi:PAS domain S-box-containing protein